MWRKLLALMRAAPPTGEGSASARRRTIELTPTPSGKAMSATGNVQICEDAGWQCLTLAVRADVSDGTALAVLLNHRPAGSIVVSNQEAELALGVTESESLPYGLPPVSGIRTVMVATIDGTAVLTGAFRSTCLSTDCQPTIESGLAESGQSLRKTALLLRT